MKYIEEIIFTEPMATHLAALLFPFGSLNELLIPIGPLFFIRFCYWSVDVVTLKQQWRVLYSTVIPKILFLQCFQLNRWENGKCNS